VLDMDCAELRYWLDAACEFQRRVNEAAGG
jgi:hypothetical protein